MIQSPLSPGYGTNPWTICMQRWLSFHPYNRAQHCDYYYLKLCNEVYDLFLDEDFPDDELTITDE